MIIDAKNLIVGRFATVAAKKALLGEEVSVVNCDAAIITGSKKEVFARYRAKRAMGIPSKGPYHHRKADRFVRRIIRGMLPYKQEKGSEAFKRVMCYIGMPPEFEGKETVTFEKANVKKVPSLKYVTIQDICKELGGKV